MIGAVVVFVVASYFGVIFEDLKKKYMHKEYYRYPTEYDSGGGAMNQSGVGVRESWGPVAATAGCLQGVCALVGILAAVPIIAVVATATMHVVMGFWEMIRPHLNILIIVLVVLGIILFLRAFFKDLSEPP